MPERAWLRFLLVGGSLAALNLMLLWGLVDGLGLPYLAACVVSFIALNGLGYLMNKSLTFRLGTKLVAREMARYFGVMLASLATNLALMFLLVEAAGLNYLAASIGVTLALAAFNFLAHRTLTFRQALQPEPGVLRVLQVSAFFPRHGGGIEAVAGQLADRLPQDDLTMVWMAGGPEDEHPRELQRPHLIVTPALSFDPLERLTGQTAPIWRPASLLALWRTVGRVDLVHLHDYLYLPTLAAYLFASVRGRPIVITQHIGDIPFTSRSKRMLIQGLNHTLGRWTLSSADQVVFVGQPVMQYFERFVPFRRPPLLVPNGVDHQRYTAEPQRTVAHDPAELLFVGRFVEKKGINLIRECGALPRARWTFVGWGPLSPAAWPEAGASNRVLERLPAHAVVPHYQHADLLVLPSTGEGFPLVVQEALACGTPVLVSAEVAEAFPEKDPRCVFEVELRCSDPAAALRSRLGELLGELERLSDARQHATSLSLQWSWERCADSYRQIYRDASAQHSRP